MLQLNARVYTWREQAFVAEKSFSIRKAIYLLNNKLIFYLSCNMVVVMAWTHTEAVLNKLIKRELVQLVPNTARVKELNNFLKNLDANFAIVKTAALEWMSNN